MMEKKETRRGKNPRASASILSILTFKWLFGIFRTGFIRELEETDLFSTLDEHSSQFLGNKLSQFWERERERCQKLNSSRQPSLLRVLIKCFGYDFLWIGLILATYTFAVRITQPIVLAHLLNHLNGDPNFDKKEAFFWGSIIVLGLFLDAMISYPAYQGLSHIGMKMRVACSSLMYKKVLKVSVAATKEKTSLGQMVNLLSNDVSRLDFAMICIHDIWIAPLQLVFVCYLMYREIGVAAIPGVFVALLFMPIPGTLIFAHPDPISQVWIFIRILGPGVDSSRPSIGKVTLLYKCLFVWQANSIFCVFLNVEVSEVV